jgi:hypothetical protein
MLMMNNALPTMSVTAAAALILLVKLSMAEDQPYCSLTKGPCISGCWSPIQTFDLEQVFNMGEFRQCEPVGKGFYSPFMNDARTMCDAGTYSDQDTADACGKCPMGSYSAKGASECTPCPTKGLKGGPKGSTDTFCLGGTFTSPIVSSPVFKPKSSQGVIAPEQKERSRMKDIPRSLFPVMGIWGVMVMSSILCFLCLVVKKLKNSTKKSVVASPQLDNVDTGNSWASPVSLQQNDDVNSTGSLEEVSLEDDLEGGTGTEDPPRSIFPGMAIGGAAVLAMSAIAYVKKEIKFSKNKSCRRKAVMASKLYDANGSWVNRGSVRDNEDTGSTGSVYIEDDDDNDNDSDGGDFMKRVTGLNVSTHSEKGSRRSIDGISIWSFAAHSCGNGNGNGTEMGEFDCQMRGCSRVYRATGSKIMR